MQYSFFIARLMGPLLLVNGAAILVNRRGFQEMIKGAARDPAVIYLTGMLSLLAGLLVAHFHNVWTPGWQVLITIVGWLAIIGGIVRMMFPTRLAALAERMMDHDAWMLGSAVISALLGGFLTLKGYGLMP